MTPPDVRVRAATVDDADVIARHRCRMFEDMGELPPSVSEQLQAVSRAALVDAIARGEYVGWLASPDGSETVVAGAGVQLRRVLPHPRRRADGAVVVAEGRHAIVLNVFTEPEWRRRGLGEILMRHVLEWARARRLDRLVLHASDDGRRLYERLGFVATNEMRFEGELDLGGIPAGDGVGGGPTTPSRDR